MNEIVFRLDGEFIELSKLLKVCGLCESGGSAKYAVAQSMVKVDGKVEIRKSLKIHKGQRVEYLDQTILTQ